MTFPIELIGFEIGVLATALFVLIADLILPTERKSFLGQAAFVGLTVSLIVHGAMMGHTGVLFNGAYVKDAFAWFYQLICGGAALVAIISSRHMVSGLLRGRGEFYILMLLALLGMNLLVSSRDFLMLFIAVELMTISFYIMSAYIRQEAASVEAGLKYLILGGLASAILVFGIAFVYGATGATTFSAIQQNLNVLSPLATLGFLLISIAMLFKVAAVPFHFWAPDVYEGAPTPVSTFLSVGSKAAAFGAFIRILVEAIPGVDNVLLLVLSVVAGITVVYGNLVAIPQTNTKRFLAYSSIGHAGYLLMGLASGSALGFQGVTYYLLAYMFSNLGAWLVFSLIENESGSGGLDGFQGLSIRSPFLAAVMFVSLLSLSGAPPLAGFFGKFLILLAVVQRGYLWLALVGAVMIVVSLYYYLMIIKRMYLDSPVTDSSISVPLDTRVILTAITVGILLVGIVPSPFLFSAQAAVRSLFGG